MNDQELKIKNFSQTWPKPSKNNPIVIIGTGGMSFICLDEGIGDDFL